MDMSYYKKYEPIFGEWKIVREIGSGSFGKVFEIEREDFGYTYKAALKAVTIPQSQSEVDSIMDDGMDSESVTQYFRGFVEELVEEFRLMSKLKGESNIVSYEDHRVIEHKNHIGWDILIRMELLTPLLKYTKEHSMTQADVVKLGIDICKALELCRKHNIIHRDIKPENIFVSENGKFKLGDFGIAKTVEKTMSGLSKKGTYTYMAPEVYKGDEYGPSVDIYSLGIVLYRYLNNNRAPFLPEFPAVITHSDRSNAIERRIKGETIPAPANADSELAAIVLKACAYDPKERYASAAEMRAALEAVLARLAPEDADDAFGKTVPLPKNNNGMYAGGDETIPLSRRDPADGKVPSSDIDGTVPFFGASATADDKTVPDTAPAAAPVEDGTTPAFGSQKAENDGEYHFKMKDAGKASAAAKESSAPKAGKKLNKKYIAAAALLALVIALGAVAFGTAGNNSSPVVDPEPTAASDTTGEAKTTVAPTGTPAPTPAPTWSGWADKLPSAVNKSDYEVEEKTQYRSRDKQTKTSTTSSKMSGWTLERTVDKGGFGAWSNWSQTKVSSSSTREVDKETRYRSRNLNTTTSSNSTMDGWKLTNTTYSWSDYGAWSDWSTTAVSASDSRKVESQKQYRYRSKSTTQQYTAWSDWSGWSTSAVSASDYRQVETRTVTDRAAYTNYRYWIYRSSNGYGYGTKGYQSGQGACTRYDEINLSYALPLNNASLGLYGPYDSSMFSHSYDSLWFFGEATSVPAQTHVEYRYRTRSLQNVTNYGDWSGWSANAVSSSSTRDVQTRTVYRYCDRHQVATYHFQRWGDWSNWTTQKLPASATTQVDSATFYRYRDKTSKKTYIFSRWSKWSDWSETPAYKSDTKQVETKTVCRYKAK